MCVCVCILRFNSKEEEIQWERATAKLALKFKEKVESGDFIPDAVRRKIEEKLHRTPEEEAILKKEKQTAVKKEKVGEMFHCFFLAGSFKPPCFCSCAGSRRS